MWQSYSYDLVLFNQEYNDKISELEKLKTNPVLPSELRALIGDYIDALEKNIELMGNVLTKLSQEIPKNYPSVNDDSVSTGWAWNEYRDKWTELSPIANQIEDWVNRYLRINF
jgi:hypothetical protein